MSLLPNFKCLSMFIVFCPPGIKTTVSPDVNTISYLYHKHMFTRFNGRVRVLFQPDYEWKHTRLKVGCGYKVLRRSTISASTKMAASLYGWVALFKYHRSVEHASQFHNQRACDVILVHCSGVSVNVRASARVFLTNDISV